MHEVFEAGRFHFEIQGVQLEFGEIKYILISGLRVGPYVDLLHEERGHSNSNLRVRLFPNITNAALQLKHLEEYIMSPQHLRFQDADAVLLIQLVFMLKSLHGWDVKTGIPTATIKATNLDSKKTHKYTIVGFMLPFKIWIWVTFPQAQLFSIHTPAELPRMRAWRTKTTLSWEKCCRMINMYVLKIPMFFLLN
uniref:Uncharacterized protein n=1 Tax=Lactuca sativa TaxID=4236 RepID=A0A9R1W4X8_LACSA|nr:hypothetical protein LSAT_V11C300128300 [Lactuca sativa]